MGEGSRSLTPAGSAGTKSILVTALDNLGTYIESKLLKVMTHTL